MTEKASERGTGWGLRTIAILQGVAAAVIVLMMFHILANVVSRYAFNFPLLYTQEFVGYFYMPIVALFGFVIAKHLDQHLVAPLIYDRLTWGNRRFLSAFASMLVTVVCAAITWFTWVGDFLPALESHATAGVSSLPVWPMALLVPIVFCVLTCYFGYDAAQAIRGRFDVSTEEDIAESYVEGATVL